LFIELKDPHIDQATVWPNGAHIDGVGVVVLLLLEPGPCGACTELAQVAYLDQLGGLVGQWCQVVADSKGDQHKKTAQGEQGAQGQPRAHAAGAHDGELRALRQARHHKDGANKHRDGQQLVEMAGDAERHEQQGVRQLVAVFPGAPNPAQLVHQVKEEEQRQKANGHEGDRKNSFAVNEAA